MFIESKVSAQCLLCFNTANRKKSGSPNSDPFRIAWNSAVFMITQSLGRLMLHWRFHVTNCFNCLMFGGHHLNRPYTERTMFCSAICSTFTSLNILVSSICSVLRSWELPSAQLSFTSFFIYYLVSWDKIGSMSMYHDDYNSNTNWTQLDIHQFDVPTSSRSWIHFPILILCSGIPKSIWKNALSS